MIALNIKRIGKTTGRWPRYNLIVDGVDLGLVRRTVSVGSDRMAVSRYDGWAIHGTVVSTKEQAESTLITRAKHFGTIKL